MTTSNAWSFGQTCAVLYVHAWSLPLRQTLHVPPRRAAPSAAQAELHKKQQIWKARKTFGLEATRQADASAQIEEVGAGAWQ